MSSVLSASLVVDCGCCWYYLGFSMTTCLKVAPGIRDFTSFIPSDAVPSLQMNSCNPVAVNRIESMNFRIEHLSHLNKIVSGHTYSRPTLPIDPNWYFSIAHRSVRLDWRVYLPHGPKPLDHYRRYPFFVVRPPLSCDPMSPFHSSLMNLNSDFY